MRKMMQSLRNAIPDMFGADLRSLALLRILIATVVILDLIGRMRYLSAHYTDSGVLSRGDLIGAINPNRWSFAMMNGTTGFMMLIFAFAFAAAIAMLLGYRTRLMAVIVWALIFSIQVRNPYLLSGADTLLRVTLFWSMFLPLGARWSLDAYFARATPQPARRATHVLSFATAAIFLQVAFMYLFTAILKEHPQWRSEGTALYYALGARDLTTDLGSFLHQFPDLLRVLSFSSLGLEFIAPILLFFPWKTGPVRTVAILSLVTFQLGIRASMEIGIFPWTSIFVMSAFLPTWFWDVALPYARAKLPAGIPARVSSWNLRGRLEPALNTFNRVTAPLMPSLSTAGQGGSPPSPPTTNVPAQPSGDGEERESTAESRSGPAPRRYLPTHPVLEMIAGALIVFVFFWNVATVSSFTMPEPSREIANSLGVYQSWSMFSPRPQQSTIWYVVEGHLEDGTQVDLLTPLIENDMTIIQAPVYDQADNVIHQDKYWRKYLAAIRDRDDEKLGFAAYACREWNQVHDGDQRLAGLDLYWFSARTLPNNQQAESSQNQIGNYFCT